MDFKKLKVLLINHSDARGGAAVVSHRLMDALCAEGVDARMLVVHKDTSSLRVAQAASSRRARLPFLAEHAEIYLSNGRNRDTLFRISTARFGLPLHKHEWVKEADIIILNWINQGMLSLSGIEKIARLKPVIWTMHDAWNMTGVCHYTDNCENFLLGCKNCPLLPHSLLAHKVYDAKLKLYHKASIHFVAVSSALEHLCRKSPLMADAGIVVIPNALPLNKFTPAVTKSRLRLRLPEDRRIVVMGAARLDDPVKNFGVAIDVLNKMKDRAIFPVFYGNIRDTAILKRLKLPYLWLGSVENAEKLQPILAHTDIVMSTSRWETLPGTVVEGISCGAVGVTTANGGQADIITDGVTGYMARDTEQDTHETLVECLCDAFEAALALPQDESARRERHHIMATKFGAPAVARRYLHLISHLLPVPITN